MQKGVKLGNWRINPAFLGMDGIKRQKVEDLSDALNGKNLNEALPVITNWNLQLKQENTIIRNLPAGTTSCTDETV